MTMPLEFSIAEGYEISAGLDRMDPVAIHAYLTNGIAVGTAVASRPPHRSVREELPHTAPTLGRSRNCFTIAVQPASPALSASVHGTG